MLAIRMQRTGRKGHAEFRIIVQDSRRTPTSGAIVAQLGHYNPHAKQTTLDKEKTGFYLEHGAQPSESVVRILQNEGVKLPSWVKLAANKSRTARHPEKLRKNQPAAPAAAEEQSKTSAQDESAADEPAAVEASEPIVSDSAPEEVASSEPVTEAESAEEAATPEPAAENPEK